MRRPLIFTIFLTSFFSDLIVPSTSSVISLGIDVFTSFVIPLATNWLEKHLKYVYKKQEMEKLNQEAVENVVSEVIEQADFWGNTLKSDLEKLRELIDKETDKILLATEFKKYNDITRDINIQFDKYAEIRMNLSSLSKESAKIYAERGISRMSILIDQLHDIAFGSQSLFKSVQELPGKKLSPLLRRSALFRFYLYHCVSLIKGWMIQTFAIDLYRYHTETPMVEFQDMTSNLLEQRINDSTQITINDLEAITKFKESSNSTQVSNTSLIRTLCMNFQRADVSKNFVITGIKLVQDKKYNLWVIQIEQAKLLRFGVIDTDTRDFKEPNVLNLHYPTFDQWLNVNYCITDEILAPSPEHVMTGIRFKAGDNTGCIEAWYDKFEFSTGEIINGTTVLVDNCKNVEIPEQQTFTTEELISDVSPITGIGFIEPYKNESLAILTPKIYSIDYAYYMQLVRISINGSLTKDTQAKEENSFLN